jgi:hypothetical protein
MYDLFLHILFWGPFISFVSARCLSDLYIILIWNSFVLLQIDSKSCSTTIYQRMPNHPVNALTALTIIVFYSLHRLPRLAGATVFQSI